MLQAPTLTPAVRVLLIVLAVSTVAQTLADGLGGLHLTMLLAMTPDVHLGLLWQWFTYPLVETPGDGAAVRRVIDLVMIYWMLCPHEERFGPRRTALLALSGTLVAALLVFTGGMLVPAHVSLAIGAGPIVWAALGAFAQLTGSRPVTVFGFQVTNAWVLLVALLALPLLDAFWSHDAARFLMAIGGAGAGILWARWIMAPRRPAKVTPKRSAAAGRLRVIEGGGEGDPDEKPRWLN